MSTEPKFTLTRGTLIGFGAAAVLGLTVTLAAPLVARSFDHDHDGGFSQRGSHGDHGDHVRTGDSGQTGHDVEDEDDEDDDDDGEARGPGATAPAALTDQGTPANPPANGLFANPITPTPTTGN